MRSSAILSLIALAAVTPSLAAPASYTKRQAQPGTNTSPAEDSEALSLGTIGTIASFAAPVIGGIIDHFRNKDKREIEEILARSFPGSGISHSGHGSVPGSAGGLRAGFRPSHFGKREFDELMARADQDESGALFGTLLKLVPTAISAISGLFGNKNKRDIEEMLTRDFHEMYSRELMARGDQDESGAFLGTLIKFIPTVISTFSSLFSNNKREFEDVFSRELQEQFARELMTRADADESGAFLGTLLKFIPTAISAFSGLFGGNKREFEELLARAVVDSDESGAVNLGNIANIASIGSSIVSAFHSLFGGGSQQQRREFEEILARAVAEVDETGALSLGSFANIASIGSSIVGALHGLFGGNGQQKREFEELLARHFAGPSGFPAGHGQFGGFRGGYAPMAVSRSLNELD